MSEDRIESSKAPEPVGLYPHARKVGDLFHSNERCSVHDGSHLPQMTNCVHISLCSARYYLLKVNLPHDMKRSFKLTT